MIDVTRAAQILADPSPNATLDELKDELNALAKLRDGARLAFCKRLAVAYMLLVGRRPVPKMTGSDAFYTWCADNLRAANGKTYSPSTLRAYATVGFRNNPAAALAKINADSVQYTQSRRALGIKLLQAVRQDEPPKPIPITRLRTQYRLPTNVAQEVNGLMRAWEQASPEARAQFIYHVTGQRLRLAA